MTATADLRSRYLNHVGPIVYRPGDRNLARSVLELLGCRVVSDDHRYLEISVDPDDPAPARNVLYAWEATPEQMEFEGALAAACSDGGPLGMAYNSYQELARQRAYEWPHFGIRLANESQLTRVVEDITAAADELRGRLSVVSPLLRTDDERGFETVQTFVYTDVLAVGLLSFGQLIEFQVINARAVHTAIDP